MHSKFQRPEKSDYYMKLAMSVREGAKCKGSRVGAVLALKDRVVSTGYNGVPQDMKNCTDGGCGRCDNRDKKFPSGTAYDICICVHAEANAILTAARFGVAVDGAVMHTTTRPCFGCAKELLQAGIREVYYIHEWNPQADHAEQYNLLMEQFDVMEKLDIADPQEVWAKGGQRTTAA